jgi:dTDP-4-dehydrorhamnose reductase
MLGQDLVAALEGREKVTALSRAQLEITDAGAVAAAVAGHDVVVNAAAWTAVDAAEAEERAALRVNGDGAANLAAACATMTVAPVMVQLSTDYVFDGMARRPYAEDAATGPRTAYGRTKLAGERAVLAALPTRGYVARTAWLHGSHAGNFVLTMARLEATQESIDVVADQHGQPTSSADLADRLRELGERALGGSAPPGVYHATSSGSTTWHGLARAVFELVGADPDRVRAVTSAQFPRPAERPRWSVLGHSRWAATGFGPMPHWRDGVVRTLGSSSLLRG